VRGIAAKVVANEVYYEWRDGTMTELALSAEENFMQNAGDRDVLTIFARAGFEC
jgi:hypothetical protein